MRLIICLDDKNGMSFNGRRQSMDKVLREKLLERVGTEKLWLSPYSARQFTQLQDNMIADQAFLQKAEKQDTCFVETQDVSDYISQFDQLIIYRWNRVYPAELHFPMNYVDFAWKLICKTEFAGNSHPTITEEIYVPNNAE